MATREILVESGLAANPEELAGALRRWERAQIEDILASPAFIRFGGPVILWMMFDDIKNKSPMRTRHLIECAAISVFDDIESSYAVGDIVGRKEYEIRRIRERTVELKQAGLWNPLRKVGGIRGHAPERPPLAK